MNNRLTILGLGLFLLTLASCGPNWTESESTGFRLIQNEGGQDLGYSPSSGVEILTVDRFAFKDLNQNGQLDVGDGPSLYWETCGDPEGKPALAHHVIAEHASHAAGNINIASELVRAITDPTHRVPEAYLDPQRGVDAAPVSPMIEYSDLLPLREAADLVSYVRYLAE